MDINFVARDLQSLLASFLGESMEITSAYIDEPLTGQHFALSGKELYEFLMCVEDHFNVVFEYSDIEREQFKTIRSISSMLVLKYA